MRFIIGNIIQANKIFKLIKNNDKIAIGVSGGKDSLVLWIALNIYVKKLKEELNWDIEIIAIHIKINFHSNIDYSLLDEWVEKNNLKLIYIDSNIGDILKQKTNKDKIQCSLCSKMKKAILVENAVKIGCNKIAMGHHADDAIETLWMNLINEGRINVFKPSTYLDRKKITLIRPLVLVREKQIIKVAHKLKLPIIKNMCPNEHSTQRSDIKDFIQKNFYDSLKWKNSYKNFLTALLNGENSSLWFNEEVKFEDLTKRITNNKIV